MHTSGTSVFNFPNEGSRILEVMFWARPAPAIHSRSCLPGLPSGSGTPSLNGSGGTGCSANRSLGAALGRHAACVGLPSVASAAAPDLRRPLRALPLRPLARSGPSAFLAHPSLAEGPL